MKGMKPRSVILAICTALAASSGCMFASKTSLNDAQAQNRILSEQNRAQLTEIENLKSHGHDMENKVIRSEEEVAMLKEQIDLDRRRLANYEQEHKELYEQFKAMVKNSAQSSTETTSQQNRNAINRTIR